MLNSGRESDIERGGGGRGTLGCCRQTAHAGLTSDVRGVSCGSLRRPGTRAQHNTYEGLFCFDVWLLWLVSASVTVFG